jgi:hypothetical protein
VSASPDRPVLHPATLAEYTAIKSEQAQRIVVRENAVYINVAALTAIWSISFQDWPDRSVTLLLVPFISALMLWVYSQNDYFVSRIKHYVRKIESEYPGISFGWESYHEQDTRRRIRRIISGFMTLLCFPLLSMFSLASFVQVNSIGYNFNTCIFFIATFLTLVELVVLAWLLDW